MRSPSPPPAATPNPYATANAQQLANVEVAIANTVLSNADEEAPGGTVSYTIDSYFEQEVVTYDTNGNETGTETRQVPRWKRTTALSESEQANYDLNIAVNASMLQWAKDQADRSNVLLENPFDLDNLPARNATPTVPTLNGVVAAGALVESIGQGDLTDHIAATQTAIDDRVEYQINLEKDRRIVQLNNQGLFAGMKAYDRAILAFDRQSNDMRLQSFLRAQEEQTRIVQTEAMIGDFANRAQAQKFQQDSFIIELKNRVDLQQLEALVEVAEYVNTVRSRDLQESIAERAQVLNEISIIKSGGQVVPPTFAQFRPGRISDTPLASSVYQSAGLAQRQYEQKVARQDEMMGGIAKLAAGVAFAPMTGGGSLAGNAVSGLLGGGN